MTLPTLTPCPKLDCKAPIAHWYDDLGNVFACRFALRGEPCLHDDQDDPCYAPRAESLAPLHLPDVDTVARAIYESCDGTSEWDDEDDLNRYYARAVLDLIAAHQPVWKRVEPIDIKVGHRVRLVTAQGDESIYTVKWRDQDWIHGYDETRDVRFPHTWYIDPATVPAEPVDPRVEVLAEELEADDPHCDDEWPCAGAERFRGVARRAIARLDEMGGEGK